MLNSLMLDPSAHGIKTNPSLCINIRTESGRPIGLQLGAQLKTVLASAHSATTYYVVLMYVRRSIGRASRMEGPSLTDTFGTSNPIQANNNRIQPSSQNSYSTVDVKHHHTRAMHATIKNRGVSL
jgi:hypothetical protein